MYRFLTKAPLVKKIRENEWEELAILCNASALAVTIVTKVTRRNGSQQTYTSSSTITGGRMYLVAKCPGDETFANVAKIEVWIEQLVESVSTRTTEIRTYYADVTARKKPTRIGWLNTLGGVDYYTFTGARASEAAVERSEYVKDLPANFTVRDRTSAVLGSSLREEFEVVSDYEPETVYQWLSKAITSPEVWIVQDGVLIPIMISSKSTPVENDALFQMKIKYHKSSDIISQNG